MKRLVIAVVITAVAFLLIGRFTAPSPVDRSHARRIDSLTQLQLKIRKELEQSQLREQIYRNLADEAERRAIQAEESKLTNLKTYEADTAANRRRRPDQRDSVLWARYRTRLQMRRTP